MESVVKATAIMYFSETSTILVVLRWRFWLEWEEQKRNVPKSPERFAQWRRRSVLGLTVRAEMVREKLYNMTAEEEEEGERRQQQKRSRASLSKINV